MTTKRGFTRYPGQRLKDVIGPHRAKSTDEDFSAVLDFTASGVQFLTAVDQSSNIQFTKGSSNTNKEVGNLIYVNIQASGSHTLTFSSDFVEWRNDFIGVAGEFDICFWYLPDGKIAYSIVERL
ncbi:MAG TPA: hypothetical protein HPP51_05435 [Planctomycetes bacterium]|nr:hypothetical protein [Planctomycetota bacterium]